MADTAKIFMSGRSQAVRLPAAYRFATDEVQIRRDPKTGDVILSARPSTWDDVIAAVRAHPGTELFPEGRDPGDSDRDPLAGIPA